MQRDDIISLLLKKGIEHRSIKHKAVFSIQEMADARVDNSERIAKNLFLRDDKKRAYYLVSIENHKTADLKALRHLIESKPLSFASEEDLGRILMLGKGEVTPFGLLNDGEHEAEFIMDSFFSDGVIGIHPNDNSETVFLPSSDLISILSDAGVKCRVLSI